MQAYICRLISQLENAGLPMKEAYPILEEPIGKKRVITNNVGKQLVPASD